MALLAVGLDMAAGVRTLRRPQRLSQQFLAATGILPGDGQAVSWARTYVYFPLQRLEMRGQKLKAEEEPVALVGRQFVDDIKIGCTGSNQHVTKFAGAAAIHLCADLQAIAAIIFRKRCL